MSERNTSLHSVFNFSCQGQRPRSVCAPFKFDLYSVSQNTGLQTVDLWTAYVYNQKYTVSCCCCAVTFQVPFLLTTAEVGSEKHTNWVGRKSDEESLLGFGNWDTSEKLKLWTFSKRQLQGYANMLNVKCRLLMQIAENHCTLCRCKPNHPSVWGLV